jgi:hypothetical protein
MAIPIKRITCEKMKWVGANGLIKAINTPSSDFFLENILGIFSTKSSKKSLKLF